MKTERIDIMAKDSFIWETPHYKVEIAFDDAINAYSMFIGHRWFEGKQRLWKETQFDENDDLSEEDILGILDGMDENNETKEGYVKIKEWLIDNMPKFEIEDGS